METARTQEPKNKPIRVLLVAPARPIIGGQTVQADRLMEALQNEPGLHVDMQAINPPFFPTLQKIKYVRTGLTSAKYVADLFRRIPKYDIIHIFSASYFSFLLAPTPAVLISKFFRKRTILNYHSGEARDHLVRWGRTAIPTIKLFDSIITPSDYLVDVFADFGISAKSIFNIIDASRFRFRERKILQPVFLSNRNFESHYNVSCSLRAFSEIQREMPDARLTVVGDGPEREKLQSLAHHLRLRNVEFLGRIAPEEMPAIYDKADVYINSSSVDNMPNSIIEAFACGLPVVSTNVGGIPYIVENGKTGLLVDEDDHRALADAALSLFADQEIASRLIAAAREEITKYSWQNVRKEWLQSYSELLDEKTGR
jgi:L-malate glycosyltransferase